MTEDRKKVFRALKISAIILCGLGMIWLFPEVIVFVAFWVVGSMLSLLAIAIFIIVMHMTKFFLLCYQGVAKLWWGLTALITGRGRNLTQQGWLNDEDVYIALFFIVAIVGVVMVGIEAYHIASEVHIVFVWG